GTLIPKIIRTSLREKRARSRNRQEEAPGVHERPVYNARAALWGREITAGRVPGRNRRNIAPDGGRLAGPAGRVSPARPVHLPQRLLARPASPQRPPRARALRRQLGRPGHAGVVFRLAAGAR